MKKKPKIAEKDTKPELPLKHQNDKNFSRSNSLLIEKKFLSIFKNMTKPPVLFKLRPFETVSVV